MQQHSDHPTLTDLLARAPSIRGKARHIMHCSPPYMFGIHGDWGAGKTSYLKQLRYHLDGSDLGSTGLPQPAEELPKAAYPDQVITIWFDAWRYQHEAVPVIALIQEIRKQFSSWDKLKNKTAKLGTVAANSLLNSLDDFAKFLSFEANPISVKNISAAGENWEKQHLEQRLKVDDIHQFLQSAITQLLSTILKGKTDKRLVIFIDDLDRCNPDAAYRLLEGLKVYLNLNNTVFVIGMNQQIIEEAIAVNLPQELLDHKPELKNAALRMRAAAYLEKLCGNIERLAPPTAANDLLQHWLEPSEFKQLMILALADPTLAQCLPPNPRRLKALANLLNHWYDKYQKQIANAVSIGEQIRMVQAMLFLAYIYQFHGELFQRLHYTPSFLNEINKWISNKLPTASQMPDYFAALELPHHAIAAPSSSATPGHTYVSTFPNPYSAKMFWIAPLLVHTDLQQTDVSPIMRAICS
jgi:hypothetical protein